MFPTTFANACQLLCLLLYTIQPPTSISCAIGSPSQDYHELQLHGCDANDLNHVQRTKVTANLK